MNGVVAVQARIAELQSQFHVLSGVRLGSTSSSGVSGSSAASSASGPEFAAALQSAASASTGSATSSGSATSAGSATAKGGASGQALIEAAREYLGVPYKWGGTDPAKGLDCSALVQRAMKDIGVDVPRTVSQQRHLGTEVGSLDKARPGDLVVIGGDRHIGIYVGDGKMLHAPRTGDVVKIGKVYETPTSIRRVLPETAPAAAASGSTQAAATQAAAAVAAAQRPAALANQTPYDLLFASATQKYGLPSGLLSAVAKVESGYNASAVSPAGAIGLMQIMPGTARELGVDPRNPKQAVDGAARLLSDHIDTFGSVKLALAAYNAGPGAVRRYDGIPPYDETQKYVKKVTALLNGGS